MYKHQKLQSEADHTAVFKPPPTSTSACLSQGALSYLASLQQTSKALQDGRIHNVLDEKVEKKEQKRRGSHSSTNATSAQTSMPATDSGHVPRAAAERRRDSLTSISSVVSELWQQKNRQTKETPLKEIRIRDAEELSEVSSKSEIPLSQKSSKKRENGNADELHAKALDGDLHEHFIATSAMEEEKEHVQMGNNRAHQEGDQFASEDKLERRTNVHVTSRAGSQAAQKLIEKSIFGASKSANVSKGNVYGNFSGSRLKEIRKSIDISLNSSSYAYDFDSDTSLETSLTTDSKATLKTTKIISPRNEGGKKKAPFANKQSPFMTSKVVYSGSSDVESILDEVESIPEEVPVIDNIDFCNGNSPNSTNSEITATIPESNSLENKQDNSTSRSSKVTARKHKADKQRSSQEETEEGKLSGTEGNPSTKSKPLSRESSKNHDSSAAESSDSISASTSRSSSASTTDTLKSVHSHPDTEGSKTRTSVSASSIRSRSLSKTSLETVDTEKAGTGKTQFSKARQNRSSSVASRSGNAILQGWESVSDTMNNNYPLQVSRRKHQEVGRKWQLNEEDFVEKRSYEFRHHNKGTQTRLPSNRPSHSDVFEQTHQSRTTKKQNLDLTHSRTSNTAMHNSAPIESFGIRKKNAPRTSREYRPTSDSIVMNAGGSKCIANVDQETTMQLAIPSEHLRRLVRLVVDEILDGQDPHRIAQSINKTNRSAQTDFNEEPIHLSLFGARPIDHIQGNIGALADSKHVPAYMLRLHVELLKREADRERRALREWDHIIHDFEQRCQVLGLDRLRRILHSKQLRNYL